MPVQTVSPDDVRQRREAGQHVEIIDVRTPGEFEQVHVDGARSVPLDALDVVALVRERDGTTNGGEPLYLICQSGARAARACEMFEAAGFTNVLSIAGGTSAWARAGLPVVRGARRMISLERQVRIGAGSLMLIGVLLGWLVHPAFFALCAVIGAGLVFAGATDWCGMGLMLAKMPWNRGGGKCDG
jgi:rhodanese-related sulfurtransferase